MARRRASLQQAYVGVERYRDIDIGDEVSDNGHACHGPRWISKYIS